MIYYLVTLSITAIALAITLVHEVRLRLRDLNRIAKLELQLGASMTECNRISRRNAELTRQLHHQPHPELNPPPCDSYRGLTHPIYFN